ncbi:S8 family peptidase [Paenibacillus turpanensis]|uniref:S8 family peptidase n=1 Tax=Paenibacillus turpanensis TaxID=2689078 RepID=UPI001FB67FE0|nr:S8 family peptidase [Paenibacillus turpanensis]
MALWFVAAALIIVLLTAFGVVLFRLSSQDDETHMPNELIVKFRDGTAAERMEEIHRQQRCEVTGSCESLGIQYIRSKKSVRRMMRAYSKLGEVEYCEPNYRFKAFFTPNDTYFSYYQYGPQMVNAPAAWDVTLGSEEITIAVVDTGVQIGHPDLEQKIVPGADFVDGGLPNDGNGHGTHVAGIAAAVTNNARGIAGMAPLVRIMPVRVLDSSGGGSLSAVANGIVFAANQGAKVINLSLGSTSGSYTLQNAVNYAWSKGAVLVAAAGNEGVSTPNYPAYYANVLAVASTDSSDRKSTFSNYGTWVEVAAPGTDILSTYPGGYVFLSGTSMAAPHVAGLAALLASQGRTNETIRDVIAATAEEIPGTGVYWVYGRINANRAVRF